MQNLTINDMDFSALDTAALQLVLDDFKELIVLTKEMLKNMESCDNRLKKEMERREATNSNTP